MPRLRISDEGLELIKASEQFRSRLYNCPAGHATIGYGHLVHYGRVGTDLEKEVPFKDGLTKAQALALLRKDVGRYESAVWRLVKVPLDQSEFDAVVDLVYNIGIAAFTDSTLLRKLNAQDYRGAALEFQKWVRANGQRLAGLVKRRQKERALFDRDLPRVPINT